MKRDIPGHLLGFFLFFIVSYYGFAFIVTFVKDISGNAHFDLIRGSGFAFIFMMSGVWLPALAATIGYYLLFRANLAATLILGFAAALLIYLVVWTNVADGIIRIPTVLQVWTGMVAAFVHHVSVLTMRLVVRER